MLVLLIAFLSECLFWCVLGMGGWVLNDFGILVLGMGVIGVLWLRCFACGGLMLTLVRFGVVLHCLGLVCVLSGWVNYYVLGFGFVSLLCLRLFTYAVLIAVFVIGWVMLLGCEPLLAFLVALICVIYAWTLGFVDTLIVDLRCVGFYDCGLT